MEKKVLAAIMAIVLVFSFLAPTSWAQAEEEGTFLEGQGDEIVLSSDSGENMETTSGILVKVSVRYQQKTPLRVLASGGTGDLSYQWYRSYCAEEGSMIQGANEGSYDISGEAGTDGIYYCEVTDGVSRAGIQFHVAIDTGLSVWSDSGENSSSGGRFLKLNYGEKASLKVNAQGGAGRLTYQWYNSHQADRPIDGATSDSFEVSGERGFFRYLYCEVTDGIVKKGIAFSIRVDTGLSIKCDYGVGSTDNYRKIKLPPGEKAGLKVKAEGGAGALSYQWYRSDLVEGCEIEGATDDSLEVEPDRYTWDYFCEVTDGIDSKFVWFSVGMDTGLVVNAAIGQKYDSTAEEDVIEEDYVFVKAKRGDEVNLGVTASTNLDAVTYQWYRYDKTEDDWMEMDGKNENACIVLADGNKKYYCRAYDGIQSKSIYFDIVTDIDFSVEQGTNILSIKGTGVVPGDILRYSNYPGGKDQSMNIVIDRGITGIDDGALQPVWEGDQESKITIPASVTEIGEKAVGYWKPTSWSTDSQKSQKCTIFCYENTAAHRYAVANGFPFAEPQEVLPVQISSCEISLTQTNFLYTGSENKPKATVIFQGKTLTEGTDYTASYANNVNAGKASVTITGTGAYAGTAVREFTIDRQPLNKGSVSLSPAVLAYNGKAQTPKVTVTVLGRTLAEGTDYDVSYQGNTNIGAAAVTVTGKGNYSETASASFTIKAQKGSIHTAGAYKYKILGTSEAAFAGTKSSKTTKVIVPKTVKIGGKSFQVTSITDNACKKSKITSVNVGDNVKIIGNSAFEGCVRLKKAIVGRGVTKIGVNTFKGCRKLGNINVKSAKLKSVGKNALKGVKANAKIKVPVKKLKAYQKLFKGKGQGKKVKVTK